MKTIEAGDLTIAYHDAGPSHGLPVILLHGFPYDIHGYDAVVPKLTDRGLRCIVPFLRGYGPTRFRSPDGFRSGQQAALGADLLALMDGLNIERALLGGYDWGGRAACIVAALWPERVAGLVSGGTGYNIQNIALAGIPASPESELRYWYQYYFHSERGRAGLESNRAAFCRLLWRLWSPTWAFDKEIFERTAPSFDNPDFVAVVIHSYRHRFGLVPGDPALDGLEAKLSGQPDIQVPTVVLRGADDGVEPSPPRDDRDAKHFQGRYRRLVLPGVGHNVPQEAPDAFAEAILSLL
ncbi:MAG: alpha/beta hydrolase [Rhodospirillaceae bacterium]|nr:alpha/beta hydrolase [Rhodospirillaceae bacterium]